MLRIVVAAPPAVLEPADLARLPACADAIELRLDVLDAERTLETLRVWIAAAPRPVMATMRSRAQGGGFDGPPAEAARVLGIAAHAGATWIDVEHHVAPLLGDLPASVEVVASYHGHDDVPLVFEIGGQAVDHHKVARPVCDVASLAQARLEAQVAAGHGDITFVPYGPLGALRSACTHARSLLYGSAAPEVAVVPGQPTLLELLDELRAGEVGPDARLYGLLGQPPTRSPSPAMHNAAFRALGLGSLYLPLPGLDVPQALELPFAGLSVTTPYKATALALADEASDAARAIGAANTLVRDAERGWVASNTDAEAVAAAVPPAASDTAFVYGAGGYARAVVFALRRRGYAVRVGARPEDEAEARSLAEDLGATTAGPVWQREATDRVLANATPVGLAGETPDFLASGGASSLEGLIVLDAPYRRDSRPTGVIALARAGGARRAVDGLGLLVLQALGQVRAFTGRDVPADVLDLAARPPRPLLLLGLRGSGKTTVGRAVARRLGRPFVDLDDEVTRVTGRTPASWIRREGETAFREREAEVTRRLEGRRGVVVAAGGGVLEHPASHEVIRRATTPVWLVVSAEVAARRVRKDHADRPALTDVSDPLEEARRILARRRDAWARVAAHEVDAERDVDEVASDVVELLRASRDEAWESSD